MNELLLQIDKTIRQKLDSKLFSIQETIFKETHLIITFNVLDREAIQELENIITNYGISNIFFDYFIANNCLFVMYDSVKELSYKDIQSMYTIKNKLFSAEKQQLQKEKYIGGHTE